MEQPAHFSCNQKTQRLHPMTNPQKILKFMKRIKRLLFYLEDEQLNFTLHQHVDQFYYMQSLEELATLFSQVQEAQQRMHLVTMRLDLKYEQTFQKWRQDTLWIHRCQKCGVKNSFYQSLSM